MKTTLELPDNLMREVKIRAAQTDRKLKDVVAEAIARGLEPPAARRSAPGPRKATARARRKTPVKRARGPAKPVSDELLHALSAAGDAMSAAGVDFEDWAKHSREVWR